MNPIPTPAPYATADLPGIGGEIKQRIEDFRVEEQPLYTPCGEGDHLYFCIEKRGIPTNAAIERIARHMHVRPRDIGMAGLKDAHAVTSQWLSLEHADPQRLRAYSDPQIRVVDVSRHGNKLRLGHLAGNRFTIRIRGVGEGEIPAARAVLDVLTHRGVPNYFGSQRFGLRGDTGALGEALVRGEDEEFVARFLGRPDAGDHPDEAAARDAFDVGATDRAMKRWPRSYVHQRKALAAFRKTGRCDRAIAAIDGRMKRLYVSAFQSAIFNAVLAERIDSYETLLQGDWAQKTDSGGLFLVEDASVEQRRADAGEISPTGPLPGSRCKLAEGEPGKLERAVLEQYGIAEDTFGAVGSLKVKGTRRALRFFPRNASLDSGADGRGKYLELCFTARSGSYATVLLREICKADLPKE